MTIEKVESIKTRKSDGINPLVSALMFMGETFGLAWQSILTLLHGRINFRETLVQMASIGADSLPIVIVTTLSTGAVFSFYTADIFVRFGAQAFLGGTLTLSFLLELGPLFAGITVAARSGAAIAAEIGSMVVTEQVDALRAMAVSPVRYLVVPRILACVIMMPILCIFADLAGILGTFIMATTHGVAPSSFIESARTYVSSADLTKGMIKTVWYGFTIAVISCHYGLRTGGGATGVGRATTSSVVMCIVLIFVSDFFLAQLLAGASITIR